MIKHLHTLSHRARLWLLSWVGGLLVATGQWVQQYAADERERMDKEEG